MVKSEIDKKNRIGRPTKMTPDTVKKLEDAFAFGCTDEEACYYADITRQTLTTYQNANPDFLDRKEVLKSRPVLKARQEVIDGLSGNPELALKFLERKRKDEFGVAPNFLQQINMAQVNNKSEPVLSKEDRKERLLEMLNALNLKEDYDIPTTDPDSVI